jgi:hypothetical protein
MRETESHARAAAAAAAAAAVAATDCGARDIIHEADAFSNTGSLR